MAGDQTVPLFVLPSGIFPSVNEPLRVFEPRYKQMLDDCTIDEQPFGYIAHNPEAESIDVVQPGTYGVLCSLEDMTEQGTNLMFTANGDKRFEVLDVIQSALPSMPFGDIYPTVDDLVEQYVEDQPTGKLYLRATIRLLDELEGMCLQKTGLSSSTIGLNTLSMLMRCSAMMMSNLNRCS